MNTSCDENLDLVKVKPTSYKSFIWEGFPNFDNVLRDSIESYAFSFLVLFCIRFELLFHLFAACIVELGGGA
jgi:hypothetical protein